MKIVVLHSKQINFFVAVSSVLALAFVTVGMLVSAKANRLLPIYCTQNDKRQIAITFDAAWDDSGVDELIEIMDKHSACSTVFVVGEWAQKYPDAVKKLDAKGHLIANHSNKHLHLKNMTTEQFVKDTKACNDVINQLTDKDVTLYRGAYGEYNNMSVEAIRKMGMYYIQWDCDSLDWKPDYTVDMIVESALKNVKPGSIMLLHIGAKNTAQALDKILSQLSSEGYQFVTVDELIYKENYYIDHTGKQMIK